MTRKCHVRFGGGPTEKAGQPDLAGGLPYEEHLKEGPYLVFDDAAKPRYKNDPRVHFVPGHPVLRKAMPELMKGLGVDMPQKAVQKWQQFQRWGMHNLEYGSLGRKALTVARPLAGAAVAAVLLYTGFRWLACAASEEV